MKGIIVVKADRCVGCRSCRIACATAHSESGTPAEAMRETPRPKPRLTVEKGDVFSVPLQCRQCAEPACMAVCPTDALTREASGAPVVCDAAKCKGCGFCVLACPFGMIRMDGDAKRIIKCDQCQERVSRDELPACVEACPTHALEFRPIEEDGAAERGGFLVEIVCVECGERV